MAYILHSTRKDSKTGQWVLYEHPSEGGAEKELDRFDDEDTAKNKVHQLNTSQTSENYKPPAANKQRQVSRENARIQAMREEGQQAKQTIKYNYLDSGEAEVNRRQRLAHENWYYRKRLGKKEPPQQEPLPPVDFHNE